MSNTTSLNIRTRCPICRAKYTVPKKSVGHHARCLKCKTRFVVQEYNHHPTEEDILRWLNEDPKENENVHSPRIITRLPNRDLTTTSAKSSKPSPSANRLGNNEMMESLAT